MAADSVFLGDFQFLDMEVPEMIDFGGPHRLSVKKLVGGQREIDSLGPDYKPIEWSGLFMPLSTGESASDRCQQVQAMKDAGLPLMLTWASYAYLVKIASLDLQYMFGRIPYRISFEVVEDLTIPVINNQGPSLGDQINSDLNSSSSLVSGASLSAAASGIAAIISAVAPVVTAVASVTSSINGVASFSRAGFGTVSQVQQVVAGAMTSASAASVIVDTNLAMLGTNLQNNTLPIAQRISNVQSFYSVSQAQTNLCQLLGSLGRISGNLANVQGGTQTTPLAGGNLYDQAAKWYGDATAWQQIAQANNLNDPQLTGINTLTIPPYNPYTTGGIPNT